MKIGCFDFFIFFIGPFLLPGKESLISHSKSRKSLLNDFRQKLNSAKENLPLEVVSSHRKNTLAFL